VAVTSTAANCQHVNGITADCPSCVYSCIKEVWPTRPTRFTRVGHYNGKKTSLLLSLIQFMLQVKVIFQLH
jgi:hypothetical protein